MCVFQGPQGPPGGLGNPGAIGEKVQRKNFEAISLHELDGVRRNKN